ncbi:Tryptophan aminotransferase-related protein 2 [Rhynchospora pubera]|uniref:Tryptophan aminotransferase-related protein 2 n=1 Tax=Rhynchospora pubera TaxID=906938 RepID=A0AAV8D3A5_9POAL|nr:Tryptophan aminotransferase-related protein 2 [Rhynchospora pubera]
MQEKALNSPGFEIDPDLVITLTHGDPIMFEPFWKEEGQNATVTISGWEKMSYYACDPDDICWFLEPDFANEVLRLHRIVNNAATNGCHIIPGAGSTQLIHATLHALASIEARRHPVNVVSAAPYYSMYSDINSLKSALYHWAGDAATFKGDDNFIEIVCSPNNPDGMIRHAVLSNNAGRRVHDMAYYWPHYTPMRGPADHDIMLFTMSKATGHAGTRIGWALVKDTDVAREMVNYITLNTNGVSRDSQVRAARILKVISDGYEFPNSNGAGQFFHIGRHLLADRWRRLRQAMEVLAKFSLPRFSTEFCEFFKEHAQTYPGFAWLRSEDESINDCGDFFKGINVQIRNGRLFGAGPNYVRISLMGSDAYFDGFIKRITSVG